MRIQIISADCHLWDEAVARFPEADLYYSAIWQRAGIAAIGEGEPLLFLAESREGTFMHVTLRRRVPDSEIWSDCETAYGYGGPLSTTRDAGFVSRAWAAYVAHAKESKIIAEFIRLHPVAANENLLPASVVMFDRETISAELEGDRNSILRRSSGQHRRNLKKAEASGIVVDVVPFASEMQAFRDIYLGTMNRAHASDFYLFNDTYFQELCRFGDQKLSLFVARLNHRPVAAALMLKCPPTLHYHLGGSVGWAAEYRPMNALFQAIFEWGQVHGFRRVHLGGGRTRAADDTLLRFKSSLASRRLKYHVARCVYDEQAYAGLLREWRARHASAAEPTQVLFYRSAAPAVVNAA